MLLRRQRPPQLGQSNISLPYEKTDKNNLFHTLNQLSQPKKLNFSELLVHRLKKNPLSETQQFYDENHKKPKEKTVVSTGRSSQLEEKEKRKRVFTGDSNVIFNEKLYEKNQIKEKSNEKNTINHLAEAKREINTKSVQETQLISMNDFAKETKENQVDINKIKEIRRALRRRYGNQRNLQKVFNRWDENHEGELNVENIKNMLSKLGLKVNLQEAGILIASCNKRANGKLTIDEFFDLIYNENELIDKIVYQKSLENTSNVHSHLIKTAQLYRDNRHFNQLQLFLKNKSNYLALKCLEIDNYHSGLINYNKFNEILEKLSFSAQILTENDKIKLFSEFVVEKNFKYKEFIEKLVRFEYKTATNIENLEEEKQSLKAKLIGNYLMEPEKEPIFHVFKHKDLPINGIEIQRLKFKKMVRKLKGFFEKKEDFQKFLQKELNISDSEIKNKIVNVKELEPVLSVILEEKGRSKEYLSTFLSNFIYNSNGDTNFSEIPSIVYDEDDEQFYLRNSMNKNGPKPQNNPKRTQSALVTSNIINQNNNKNNNLIKILEKIDSKVFCGRNPALKVFKFFDTDQDGFVSHNDLLKTLDRLNVLNTNETKEFLNYFDPNEQGFLNFEEFSIKIKPNMGKTDLMGNNYEDNSLFSYKNNVRNLIANQNEIKKKYDEIKNPFRPQSQKLLRNQRFDATPVWKDTFEYFRPQTCIESNRDRCSKEEFMKTEFQKEEKEKKKNYFSAKLEKIKENRIKLEEKIESAIKNEDFKKSSNLEKKAAVQWAYEQRCKIRNEM